MDRKELYLLDAFALIFRAYYAMIRNPRVTSYGKNTNAQFGFTNSLIDVLNNVNPSHIAVCFDSPEQTERNVEFAEYKANREAPPEDLLAAIPDIKQIIEGFNIPIVEIPGYEADDIIGGLAKQAEKKGYQTYMVTPDKDFGQLVSENIFMYVPAARGDGPKIMGPKEVCEKWGIQNVDQVIDVLGLMGDASDNIPGIKGVGEKTAVKLLNQYNTLENVLDHADEIPGKLGEKVENGKEDALMSKRLATIITDIPYTFDEELFLHEKPDKEKLDEIFQKLEFRTLGKRILGDEFKITQTSSPAQPSLFSDAENAIPEPTESHEFKTLLDLKVNYKLVDDEFELDEMFQKLNEASYIAIDTETTGLNIMEDLPVGISMAATEHQAFYINLNRTGNEVMLDKIQKFFDSKERTWIGHNIKYDKHMLQNIGLSLNGSIYDTLLAHYVIDAGSKHSLDFLAQKYLHYKPISIEKLIGPKGKAQMNMKELTAEKIKNYACEDADVTLRLYHYFQDKIDDDDNISLIKDLECPLSDVLLSMETQGVSLDVPFLNQYSEELTEEIESTKKEVFEMAGTSFNLSSPKQLGEILFDKMKLVEKPKKTKTGQYKTNEEELSKLRDDNPIIDKILNYRELTKLKSTYVDALPKLVNEEDGKVHTTFSQSIAVTGRLSSTNPNLQNIPIKTERGKRIRKAFVASDGNVLVSADYSQVELRVIAYMADDPDMIEAFRENKDIHTATASKVFGVPEDTVTPEMRYKAKAVNFGIIYGQTPFGLSQSLGIPRGEASEIIQNYFKQFRKIKEFMDNTIKFAKDNGFVSTLLGRKRYLPDINSSNAVVRGYAERNAINSPIQGTAADLIKLAMLKIQEELSNGYESKLILQVHDELILDVKQNELDTVKKVVVSEMQSAMDLGEVPLVVSIGSGANWLEAH